MTPPPYGNTSPHDRCPESGRIRRLYERRDGQFRAVGWYCDGCFMVRFGLDVVAFPPGVDGRP
jgi:hypothetical protein